MTENIKIKKNILRKSLKLQRNNMLQAEKDYKNQLIYQNIKQILKKSKDKIIFTYVSSKIEVDTFRIIDYSLKAGKYVAVPKCLDNLGNMEFYCIPDLDCLKLGSFGILEPIPQKCKKISDYSTGICFVPGLSFDKQGFRLGYGKGYYDRFLKKFNGTSIGLCYESNIKNYLPYDQYDQKVNALITDQKIRQFQAE